MDTLSKLIKITPEEIQQKLSIPYEFYGFEWLRVIIYHTKLALKEINIHTAQTANQDIQELKKYFFEQLKKQTFNEYSLKNNSSNTSEAYQEANIQLECFKEYFSHDVDVLQALLCDIKDISELRQAPVATANVSNSDYFNILALNKAAAAIDSLSAYQILQKNNGEDELLAENELHPYLADAIDAMGEAIAAVDFAKSLSPKNKNITAISLTQARHEMARQSANARHKKNRLRKEKAIQLYQDGSFHSRNEAALRIAPFIRECSEELGIPPLTENNEIKTIYGWLSSFDKDNQQK